MVVTQYADPDRKPELDYLDQNAVGNLTQYMNPSDRLEYLRPETTDQRKLMILGIASDVASNAAAYDSGSVESAAAFAKLRKMIKELEQKMAGG